MFIFPLIWNWIIGHSPREIAIACAVLALGLFCGYEIMHQRNIGYDECKADYAKEQASAQAIADKAAPIANAQIHSNVDEILAPLPDYLKRYEDKSRAADCPAVTYVRKIKPS